MQLQPVSTWRGSVARFFAPTVWIGGAFASSVVGLTSEPLAGAGVLALAAIGTLLLMARAIGWKAVPVLFTLVAAQAPILVQTGFTPAQRLGEASSVWTLVMSPELFFLTTLGSIVLASPAALLMRLEGPGFERLRRIARLGAPAALLVCAALVTVGAAARVSRFPSRAEYVASLPVHAVLPGPEGQLCKPVAPPPDAQHDDYRDLTSCSTSEMKAAPLVFHYHCRAYRDEPRGCGLMVQHDGEEEEPAIEFGREMPSAVTVLRDESQGAWLVKHDSGASVVAPRDLAHSGLYFWQIRARIAPPLGWLLLGAGGIVVALLCAASWLGARRFVDATKPGHAEWLERLRGDLSIVAFGSLVCAGALLLAALLSGYLL